MTFNESDVTATCCMLDGTPVSVTCGRGFSCAASCFSLKASLCPSHYCEACDDIEEQPQRRQNSVANQASSSLAHCTPGCRVRGSDKKCCFHPSCAKIRPRQCAWLRYTAGEICLEEHTSRVPMIPSQVKDALDLAISSMASGHVHNRKFLFLKLLTWTLMLKRTQHFNVVWIATQATLPTSHLSSLVLREVMTHSWKNSLSFCVKN